MHDLRFTICDLKRLRQAALWVFVAASCAPLAGCTDKFWDPGQIGRFRPTPAVNVILDTLGVAEEAPVAWENAEEPRPSDIVATRTDYVLQPGDLVRISIFELMQEGVALVNDYLVSETGKVSIPEAGIVQAAGLTETQLEEQIKQILSPNILRNPSVTVMLMSSQQRTFAVLGNAVARPNRYMIPRYDFRLMDALATAQAEMQFNVSYVYVSRKEEGPGQPIEGTTEKQMPELELIKPGASLPQPQPLSTQPVSNVPPALDEAPKSIFGPAVPAAPAGGRTRGPQSGQRDIPEPTEPAQKFESERDMLDLITPRATAIPPVPSLTPGGWPPAGRVVETPAADTATRNDDITASALAYGFRPLGSPGTLRSANTPRPFGFPVAPQGRQTPPSQRTIASPTEFGAAVPAGSDPVIVGSKQRIEWIFKDGAWVPVSVGGAQSVAPARTAGGSGLPAAPSGSGLPATPSRSGLPAAPSGSTATQPAGDYDWVFRDNQWVPVPHGQASTPPAQLPARTTLPVPARGPNAQRTSGPDTSRPAIPETGPAAGERLPTELEWEQAIQTRLIKIPTDKLLAGDPRYNIVIQPGDTIHVPVDLIGEFTIMGNVNRVGPVNITGRPWTLMMAIAAAGGLGPLAQPKHVEVVRRIGTQKEEIVMVDLDKIAAGEQPDFFIKPNDLINVGTEITARWKAVLRNAFRAAYGFAFVYDRNFADIDYGTGFPWFSSF
jgi:protein involved in polysaccharide export with SLBB domain